MVPDGTLCGVSVSSSSQFPSLFLLGADFGRSHIDVGFGSAICSDVTSASTAETFSVSFYPSLLLCLCLVRDEI